MEPSRPLSGFKCHQGRAAHLRALGRGTIVKQISSADLAEVVLVLKLLVVIPAAVAAFLLERKRRKRMPGTKAYTWGFYLGLSTFLVGLSILSLFVTAKPQSWAWDGGTAVISVVAGFGAMRRYRLGLIGSVLLSLNPIWWLVGSSYIENRWVELSEQTHGRQPGSSLAWFRYGWRVLALLGAAYVAWEVSLGLLIDSAFDAAVSVSSAGIGVFAVRHFLLKPRRYPLVWYVTLSTSVVACTISWLTIHALSDFAYGPADTTLSRTVAFAVGQGLRQGLTTGSCIALLVFAARGRVEDPWVSPGTVRLLWTRARSWPYNPSDELAP
jgi:hypothetical protein